MSKINLTPTTYVQFDGRQYSPYYFEKGDGKMVRDVKSNKMVEKKDKWVHTGTYHTKISDAIRTLAVRKVLEKDEWGSLQEAVNAYEAEHSELTTAWEKVS